MSICYQKSFTCPICRAVEGWTSETKNDFQIYQRQWHVNSLFLSKYILILINSWWMLWTNKRLHNFVEPSDFRHQCFYFDQFISICLFIYHLMLNGIVYGTCLMWSHENYCPVLIIVYASCGSAETHKILYCILKFNWLWATCITYLSTVSAVLCICIHERIFLKVSMCTPRWTRFYLGECESSFNTFQWLWCWANTYFAQRSNFFIRLHFIYTASYCYVHINVTYTNAWHIFLPLHRSCVLRERSMRGRIAQSILTQTHTQIHLGIHVRTQKKRNVIFSSFSFGC